MEPEVIIGIIAVFLAGGAVGTAGTLLMQWLFRNFDGPSQGRLEGPEYDVVRREVAELGRQMRNVDARLDFTEKLLGGALPIAPPPDRFEPRDTAEEPDDDRAPDEDDAVGDIAGEADPEGR